MDAKVQIICTNCNALNMREVKMHILNISYYALDIYIYIYINMYIYIYIYIYIYVSIILYNFYLFGYIIKKQYIHEKSFNDFVFLNFCISNIYSFKAG